MTDLHKVFIDDESYNSGHGHAFDTLGVDPKTITVVAIRPDQCKRPDCKLSGEFLLG